MPTNATSTTWMEEYNSSAAGTDGVVRKPWPIKLDNPILVLGSKEKTPRKGRSKWLEKQIKRRGWT